MELPKIELEVIQPLPGQNSESRLLEPAKLVKTLPGPDRVLDFLNKN